MILLRPLSYRKINFIFAWNAYKIQAVFFVDQIVINKFNK